jgi:hypothetical protein
MANLVQTFYDLWSAVTRRKARESMPELVVHDPGALKPHDLDDPFLDPQAQSRIGRAIADNATKQ